VTCGRPSCSSTLVGLGAPMVVSISRDHAKVTPSQFVGGFNKLPVRSLGVRPFLFVGFEGVCGVGLSAMLTLRHRRAASSSPASRRAR
jgi:hypothetical protein